MTNRFISRITVALMAIFALTVPALAQKIIVVDSTEVLGKSQVGQHIDRQLKSIESSMKNELKSLSSPIETEAKSLAAQTKGMSMEALKGRSDLTSRITANQKKMAKYQYEEQMKAREIVITRNKALAAVAKKIDTILTALAKEKGADVVLDRKDTVYVNPSVNMTQTVITRLNSQMPTTPVNRERLPRKQ